MWQEEMGIGEDSYDVIVQEETGGQAYYMKTEARPDWPGGASGVTVGIGYDCGYATRKEIGDDWGPFIDPSMVRHLQSVAGVHGSAARGAARELHGSVYIPWATAIAVFDKIDVPKWVNLTRRALRNFDELPPDCRGALVSLSFNRGASYHAGGDRCREMRAIAADMANRNFADIPRQFRLMKRLWPAGGDLWRRREHEAVLFENALHPDPHNIKWVQEMMNHLGYADPPLDIDGSLGTASKTAVRAFQRDHGLMQDGLPGPLTKAMIEKAEADHGHPDPKV